MAVRFSWKRFIFFLALLCAASAAAAVSMLVPAVLAESGQSDENGQMIRINLEARNGTGLVYISTSPLIGTDTQSSERTAVAVGMSRAGVDASGQDVLASIDAAEARRVDGPSAGAAMTLLTISAVTGKRIRSDFTITGTITSGGDVGAVGGIPSKVEAAARNGMKVVAVPSSTSVADKIILAALKRKTNLSIIEVGSIQDAEALAFSPQGSVPQETVPDAGAPLSGLAEYNYSCTGCGLAAFRRFAQTIVGEMDAAVAQAGSSGAGDYSSVVPYIRKSAADSREMVAKGYYYTGANNAFLTLIDARVLANSSITRPELDTFLSEVGACTDSLQRPLPTKENLEFLAGGDLRATWARRRLADVRAREETEANDLAGLLGLYRDSLSADGWCKIARGLYAEAELTGGERVNESVLQGFAYIRLAEAEDAFSANLSSDSDAEWHLLGAEAAYNSSLYAASVLDSDYVISFAEAGSYDGENGNARARELASRQGSTLWSALFYAHAAFFTETGGEAGVSNALTVGTMAENFEQDVTSARNYLAHPETAPPPEAASSQKPVFLGIAWDWKSVLIVSLCFLLVASQAVTILVFMRMRSALAKSGASRPPPHPRQPARRRRK